jgi:DNA-binding Xre family transcriptional regulator
MKKTILSGRIVKSKAAFLGISLSDLNDRAGFGSNYIYRLWDRDKVTLESVNKIASVLGCKACDLLEEVEGLIEGSAPSSSEAGGTLTDKPK